MKKFLILLLFFFLNITFLYANVGKITAIKGDVTIERVSQSIVAKLGSIVNEKDSIKTGKNARAQIVFKDNTIISVGKNSSFSVKEYLFESKKPVKASFSFGTGVFKTITGKIGKINPKKFKLNTKTSSIGIRGTIVGLESTPEADIIIVPEGQIEVVTPEGIVTVNQGQMTEVKQGETPEVKEIPKQTQQKMDKESGAKANEEESGQGEATQTNELTTKEKEEAKEQKEKPVKETKKEETKEEKKSEEEKTQKEETSSEEKTQTKEDTSDSNNDNSLNEENKTNNDTGIENENDSTQTTTDGSINSDTNIEVVTEEPTVEVKVDIDEVVENVDEVVSDTNDTVSDTETTTTTTTTSVPLFSVTFGEGTQRASQVKDQESSSNQYFESAFAANINSSILTLTPNVETNLTVNSTVDLSSYTQAGTYSKHFDIKTDLSFSKFISPNTYSGTYTIHSDDRFEFLVGYAGDDETSTRTLIPWIINSITFNYRDLFFTGVKTTLSKYDSSKIYIYDGFRKFEVTTNGVSSDISSSEIKKSTDEKFYVNPNTQSAHFLDLTELYDGAIEFNAAKINSDGSINVNYLSVKHDVTDKIVLEQGTATGNVYGNDAQGLGFTSSSTSTKDLAAQSTIVGDAKNGAHTYYLDETKTITNSSAYSSNALTGFINSNYYNSGTSTILTEKTLSLNVDQSNGTITGSLSSSAPRNLTMAFSGSVAAQTSYYISDDLFGVVGTTGSINDLMATSQTRLSNTNFLVALPDDIDTNGDYVSLDDESSWGYWTSSFSGDSYIDPTSTWIAGVESASTTITTFLATSGTATFNGHVLGAVENSGTDVILFDSNNNVDLTFTFGTGKFNGNINFQTKSGASWTTQITNGVFNSTGFDAGTVPGQGTVATQINSVTKTLTSSKIDGTYFGQDSVKSVGGTFNLQTSDSGTAYGVFKAN